MTVSKLKVMAISDTHGQHNLLNVPECDILVHCGDFSRNGSYENHFTFARWMGQQNAKYKIVVPGNHDAYSQQQTSITVSMFEENGITLLIDKSIEIEGRLLYGSPWTPVFGRWHWMKKRGLDIKRVWDNIPNDLDLLITHGPAFGVMDYLPWDKVNAGCEELTKAIDRAKPKKLVQGHFHLYGGKSTQYKDTIVYNAAICDESYKPVNPVTTFEI